MRAEIITTGSELLVGNIVDTNSLFLSEELMLIGLETAFKTTVGDDEKDLDEVLQRAISRVDAVIVTGGIGPTEDDITRKAIAKIAKRRIVLNEDALKAIERKLAGRSREIITQNGRQALIPAGARLLQNPVGIAPGFYIDEDALFLAVLPGVPKEMKAMFTEGLQPVLNARFGGESFMLRRIVRTCGISESAVNQAIEDILKRASPAIGLTAKETGVDVRIISASKSREQARMQMENTEAEIRQKLGDAIYGVDGQELEEVVGALLSQKRSRIAIAESCTGGLISARMTNVSGSSVYFERSVIVYSNLAKTELLDVPLKLIEQHGAVSAEVAAAMAEGIRRSAHTDLGLAVTGIAGPGGGTEIKPVGLVYIALSTSGGVKGVEHRFLGTREQVRLKAAQAALDMVRRHLIG